MKKGVEWIFTDDEANGGESVDWGKKNGANYGSDRIPTKALARGEEGPKEENAAGTGKKRA